MSQRVWVARAFPELNVRPGDLSLSPSGQWGSLPRAKKDLSPLRDPLERLGEAGGGDRRGEARRKESVPRMEEGPWKQLETDLPQGELSR